MDSVESPAHYKRSTSDLVIEIRAALIDDLGDADFLNMECFIAMVNCLDTVDQIRGYLRGNSFKYRWRYRSKGVPVQDLKKAQWYEKKLLVLEQAITQANSKGIFI